jgi:Uma2 family endonuclease
MEAIMADAALSVPRFTVEQYQDIERDSSVKHEFVNGLVYAMAGTSNWHNLVALNFIGLLNAQLPERCRALGMDVQLHIKSLTSDDFFYPDVFVSCGDLTLSHKHEEAFVVCEVLSPTTENYDRGAKMLEYRQLSMLEEYVLLRPDAPIAEVYRRSAGWTKQTIEGHANFRLESLGVEVALTDLYRRIPIEFPPTSGTEPKV